MGAAHIILLTIGIAGVLVGTLLDARDAGPEALTYRRGVPSHGWHRHLLRAGSLFAILFPLLDAPALPQSWSALVVGAIIALVVGGSELLAVTVHNRTRIERMRRGL
ncbi:hypothetical protein [Arenivirga flava]|uniref:Uncharacterized protein n=1 Tax=Arenivirga flava TaxID=1930060 RepID=A0AA37XA92_9MICO|nr:hypothetical protein [Arenivirga flava]GMA27226.1 hypothetical protein GCM10025874_04790 [Arenivirga flava]